MIVNIFFFSFLAVAEEGRPRVLRGNDRLGSQWVLSGFSWVLMSTHGFSVGSHGFSWVLMGSQWVLRLCIFGFSGGSQAGTPPSVPRLDSTTVLYLLICVSGTPWAVGL